LDPVSVVPYDPAWPGLYEAEAQLILRALGDIVVSIHHIGSTAIPGVFAKPIIDVLEEVVDLTRLDELTWAMLELGYEALGEYGIAGRRYFRKRNRAGVRTHHVHCFCAGSPEIERLLAFRDYMIAHPVEAEAYGALKRELAQAHPDDRQAYVDGKDEFVKVHQARALAWKRSHPSVQPTC
jgi:GrpB-like predicted nucleotidyltransferase (UPF0157 family)